MTSAAALRTRLRVTHFAVYIWLKVKTCGKRTSKCGLSHEALAKCGGSTYTFLKHQSADELIEDLTLLYVRLVDLGMEYRNGTVYLADLETLEKQDV